MSTNVQSYHKVGGLDDLFAAATALAGLTTGHSSQTIASSVRAPNNTDCTPSIISDEEASHQRLPKCIEKHTISEENQSRREIFPQRLMAILNDDHLSDIIAWLPHGLTFVIVRPDLFTAEVLPKYLPAMDARSSTKYPSFTRKLNRWGFRQATRGPDTGAFHHPLFRRDKPALCLNMVCQRSRDQRKPLIVETASSSSRKAEISIRIKKGGEETVRVAPPQAERVPTSKKDETAVITPLNDTSFRQILVAKQSVAPPVVTVSVSGNVSSISASSNLSSSVVLSHTQENYIRFLNAITIDTSLIQRSLQQRDEYERLRLAKALLYQSFLDAKNQSP